MVRTALLGVPSVAPLALLRVTLTVSSASSAVSLVMATVKVLFAESAAIQFRMPDEVV